MSFFGEPVIYCVAKARLDLGEDPAEIYRDLMSCKVIDITALRVVMDKLAPGKFHVSDKKYKTPARVFDFDKMPESGVWP